MRNLKKYIRIKIQKHFTCLDQHLTPDPQPILTKLLILVLDVETFERFVFISFDLSELQVTLDQKHGQLR